MTPVDITNGLTIGSIYQLFHARRVSRFSSGWRAAFHRTSRYRELQALQEQLSLSLRDVFVAQRKFAAK